MSSNQVFKPLAETQNSLTNYNLKQNSTGIIAIQKSNLNSQSQNAMNILNTNRGSKDGALINTGALLTQ